MTNFDKGHTKYGLDADANLISAILGSMQNIREKDTEAAYALSATAAEPTLDQVNSGNVADVSQTMYMAYDEGGQRIWTAFRGAGVDEEFATMPGVGKYYAQHVSNDVGFTMTQMDLVAGGFRDMNSGIAYYPVTDMQGNVRAYASTGGLNGAIDYYAYGTSSEIVHGNVEDNKRWQGKEEDGSIRKLYFGSRYFDPFFGMWLTPDPAGQFANPYTYGGDPVNYVDPNGEFVHVLVGAVVGAVVGTVNGAIQCTAPGGGSCGKAIAIQAGVGLLVGGATAATGGAVSGLGASVVGSAGLASGSGTVAALAGGAVEGAITGAVGGAAGYALSAGINKAQTGSFGWDKSEFFWAIGMGSLTGAGAGALSGALSYNLSDSYKQNTLDKIENYGFEKGRHSDVMKFDYDLGEKQRAVNYYANKVRGYNDIEFKYQPNSDGSTRGFYDPAAKKI